MTPYCSCQITQSHLKYTHTDASDYAIGGVLVQEGHPIAYESRKLIELWRESRGSAVQEKEITAIVHCLNVRDYRSKAGKVTPSDQEEGLFPLAVKSLSRKH